MNNKKIYYLPTTILVIYAIIYIPLLKYLVYINSGNLMAYECNLIMDKISICVVIISVILKLIFTRKRCKIEKDKSDLLVFIILMIFIFFIGIMSDFA